MEAKYHLRSFLVTDAHSLALNANHIEIWEGVRDVFPFPYSLSDAEIFIAYARLAVNEKVFAIDIDGKAVGAIGLRFKDDVYRYCGELGYWIGPRYKGKGITTQAVGQVISLAFDEFNLLRLYAEVFERNDASVRVLEKNGFRLEATLKSAIYKNNSIRNLLIFTRINPNWGNPHHNH